MSNKSSTVKNKLNPSEVVKPLYFSNWGDVFGYPLAYRFLPTVLKFSFITPNLITLTSFCFYFLGSILLFWQLQFHLILSAILLVSGFVLDDLDGQVARARKLNSQTGDFLDKTLDVLKIFILTVSLGLAVYLDTHSVMYIYLAFIACFFFMYRYYIKLETMFGQISLDSKYLEKSQQAREKLSSQYDATHAKLQTTLIGKLTSFWHTHKLILFVDEAEFAFFTAIGAIFNQLKMVVWILAFSQVTIGIFRFAQRMHMIRVNSRLLTNPLRK